ncbi:inter-alpha-trypsin inhibitor heavy chain H4-like isoform X2 [Chrysoperla carnea]|uniref:inter-alpha-trypsin inhibitor heavy chain H4-like isoform X2 n=1 Tax=Chrysoperla carnea TaxID=189513 RepID=UPI001D08EE90|nr:inter-alpha-trypsin inhibitor heavy chain H4-like isoform X2 [Chrysoperla carnea]
MRLLSIICCIAAIITNSIGIPVNDDSFVTVSPKQEFTTPSLDTFVTQDTNPKSTSDNENRKPNIYSMKVYSVINTRYATNVVSSRIANPANNSQEVTFSIVIPETAFISEFLMELDGKVFKAFVKKKDEAKQIYDQAVSSGIGAAHVSVSARDSNRFTVSVNVEPHSKATFNLTYEELLTRRLGVYNLVINLHPRQLVRDMSVDVDIIESEPITILRTPVLRTGNEIDPDENTENNKYATKEFKNNAKTMAHIRFSPTIDQQKQLINDLKNKNKENPPTDDVNTGVSGQFVVQYDVSRDFKGGSMVVYDGYFVHFFAPNGLKPLNKHVIFVLDVSYSMIGSKLQQLRRAMNYILDDLHPGDYFNLIAFNYNARVYDLSDPIIKVHDWSFKWFDHTEEEIKIVPAYAVNANNIAKAKTVIDNLEAYGGTNINIALKVALKIAQAGVGSHHDGPNADPLIMFLTDGDPTVGETRTSNILKTVNGLNKGSRYSSIFALAFGNDADRGFLKQLAIRNSGFMRHIYEAHDADIQLQQFYKQISSPILKNVSFAYPDNQVENLTNHNCHTLFNGSEFITTGKLIDKNIIPQLTIFVPHETNHSQFKSINIVNSPTSKPSLERLWAFLKIKQLLDKKDAYIDPDLGPTLFETTESPNTKLTEKSIEKQALEIALKYSFVTKLTSLVVVKPNSTSNSTSETLPVPIPVNKPSMALALNSRSQVFGYSPSTSSRNFGGYVSNSGWANTKSAIRMAFTTVPRTRSYMRAQLISPRRQADVVSAQDNIDRNDNIYSTTPFRFTSTIPISTTVIPITVALNHTQLLKKYGLENFDWLNISDGFVEINGVIYSITDLPESRASFGRCNNADDGKTGVCVPVNKCQNSWTTLTNETKYKQYKCNGVYLGNNYFTMCCDIQSVRG